MKNRHNIIKTRYYETADGKRPAISELHASRLRARTPQHAPLYTVSGLTSRIVSSRVPREEARRRDLSPRGPTGREA